MTNQAIKDKFVGKTVSYQNRLFKIINVWTECPHLQVKLAMVNDKGIVYDSVMLTDVEVLS